MWKARRRLAALSQAVVILLLPFLSVGGKSALRFDIPELALYFFGTVVWIDQFFLVLLGTIFAVLFAAGVTILFGRIWCGWLCPQTVIPELAAWAASLFPERWSGAGTKILLFPLSGLVSFSLITCFLPPAEALGALFRPGGVFSFFLAQWAVIFFMLAVAGTSFCRTVCPYSMLQNALFDRDTLTIAFDGVRGDRCMRCDLCVHVCPVAIDIKKGAQRECIACADCIDACRLMTGPRGIAPFIGYRGRIVRGKAAVLAALTAAAGIAFLAGWHLRPPVAFTVRWVEKVPDSPVNRYRYAARNNRGEPVELVLQTGGAAKRIGERTIRLGPNSRSSGDIEVEREGEPGGSVTFVVSGPGIHLRKEAAFP